MAKLTYHEQKDLDNTKKLRALIKELPPFCSDFSEELNPAPPPVRGLPMPMICGYSLIF